MCSTSLRRAYGYHDSMDAPTLDRWKFDRQWNGTPFVEEDAVGELSEPPLGPADLLN